MGRVVCLVVDGPHKRWRHGRNENKKRSRIVKGNRLLKYGSALECSNEIINALAKRNLFVDFGLQTGLRLPAYGARTL